MNDFPKILETLLQGNDLSTGEMSAVMKSTMSGELSQVQLAAFLAAMRCKEINTIELSSAAKVMRSFATQVKLNSQQHVLDTCGSGGDSANTFNISTASAFVAAAGGAKVAKHGNKAVSSSSGSADVLVAAGAKLELSPEQVAEAIDTIGFGFIFAPLHHSAMKHVAPVRQELRVRTMFNMLGPLTNPAGCLRQVVGIFSPTYVRLYAETLQELGSEHVIVVHSEDGLDEISCAATTHCAELKDGKISEYDISPEDFGLTRHKLDDIKSDSIEASLTKIKAGLISKDEAAATTIALNAGAGLYVAGISDSIKEGVTLALQLIQQGTALKKLADYVAWSNSV